MASAPATEMKVPDHVPPELVRKIGLMLNPEFLADPYDYFPKLHDTVPPVYYDLDPRMGGSWVTIKHDLAFKALRNAEDLTIETTQIFPRDPGERYFHLIPQELDPPVHRKFRNVLDPYLSPKAVLQLEKDIRALANDLIDKFIDRG